MNRLNDHIQKLIETHPNRRLDSEVFAAKKHEADAINRQGLKEQLGYLACTMSYNELTNCLDKKPDCACTNTVPCDKCINEGLAARDNEQLAIEQLRELREGDRKQIARFARVAYGEDRMYTFNQLERQIEVLAAMAKRLNEVRQQAAKLYKSWEDAEYTDVGEANDFLNFVLEP